MSHITSGLSHGALEIKNFSPPQNSFTIERYVKIFGKYRLLKETYSGEIRKATILLAGQDILKYSKYLIKTESSWVNGNDLSISGNLLPQKSEPISIQKELKKKSEDLSHDNDMESKRDEKSNEEIFSEENNKIIPSEPSKADIAFNIKKSTTDKYVDSFTPLHHSFKNSKKNSSKDKSKIKHNISVNTMTRAFNNAKISSIELQTGFLTRALHEIKGRMVPLRYWKGGEHNSLVRAIIVAAAFSVHPAMREILDEGWRSGSGDAMVLRTSESKAAKSLFFKIANTIQTIMRVEKIRKTDQLLVHQDYEKLLNDLTEKGCKVIIYDVNSGVKETLNAPKNVERCLTLLKIKIADGYHYEPLV